MAEQDTDVEEFVEVPKGEVATLHRMLHEATIAMSQEKYLSAYLTLEEARYVVGRWADDA